MAAPLSKSVGATGLQPKVPVVATTGDQSIDHQQYITHSVIGRSEGGGQRESGEGERILIRGNTEGDGAAKVRRPSAVVGRRDPGGADDPRPAHLPRPG